MNRDIIIEWHFTQSVEKVWDMLTNPELVKIWNPQVTDFNPVVGFEFEQHQKPRGDWDGNLYHKVLKVEPLKKLSYTFQSGPKVGVITLDTVVTFKLHSDEKGSVLRLEHTGFKGTRNCITSLILEMGWKKPIAKRFKSILEKY